MRLSKMLFVTLRENPAEAEIPSHQLLLRAGYIRRIASGVFSYLPLMWRVLRKVSQIVREEMDAAGAQECLLPQLQPADLWQESGRWETYTQTEGIMFSLVDRAERQMGLGPTHEEVITAIARDTLRSYRQLPVNLYQIQAKFRDEIRPRFGLLRGREFVMKDAYSFNPDEESLQQTYEQMYQAYSNIFRRCGVAFRVVEADSGAIGGSQSHEFMVLAEAGEDEILYTEDEKYAANIEKAVSKVSPAKRSPFRSYEKVETPNTETIEKVCQVLDCSPSNVLKNVLYQVLYDNGKTVIALIGIRGDQDINEVKLQNELGKLASHYGASKVLDIKVPDAKDQEEWASEPLPLGYIAPDLSDDYIRSTEKLTRRDLKEMGLSDRQVGELVRGLPYYPGKGVVKIYSSADIQEAIETRLSQPGLLPETSEELQNVLNLLQKEEVSSKFLRLVDKTAVNMKDFVTGANEVGYHVVGANWGQQFPLPAHVIDVRMAKAGDRAVHDHQQVLHSARGIEVGHIFQLGTKYSQALGATYTTKSGENLPLVMGCYGIGISRLAQACIEQRHDDNGMMWPVAIAPYHVLITVPKVSDSQQMEAAEQLYQQLHAAGIETLLDDREESPGVKFKDADLIGIPYRLVTGRALKSGKVELVERETGKAEEIPLENVVETLTSRINAGLAGN
ncbi:proline--tRNA ligase [Geitlerinema sp. PCC 9228]|uniref:proline--tRNA ligase n=1 Tax=Geitlerinema sp. PCC 9228 TaxID=111611 RepID=UPI0008F9D76A|nr:proline--tRNA ligase [Geitlerinema sp. PCC 9228]